MYEVENSSTFTRAFVETAEAALAVTRTLVVTPGYIPGNQLEAFIGPIIFNCFDLSELMKILS